MVTFDLPILASLVSEVFSVFAGSILVLNNLDRKPGNTQPTGPSRAKCSCKPNAFRNLTGLQFLSSGGGLGCLGGSLPAILSFKPDVELEFSAYWQKSGAFFLQRPAGMPLAVIWGDKVS